MTEWLNNRIMISNQTWTFSHTKLKICKIKIQTSYLLKNNKCGPMQFKSVFLKGVWDCAQLPQSCWALCDPMDHGPPASSVHCLGKNTGVGCHALFQENFLAQRSKPSLLQLDYLPLSHQGSSVLNYTLRKNVDYLAQFWYGTETG